MTGDAGAPLAQRLCQRDLRAPRGQRVRLAFASVAVAEGAFLFAFDGTTEEVELAQLAAGQARPAPALPTALRARPRRIDAR